MAFVREVTLSTNHPFVPLARVIEDLRAELLLALSAGAKQPLRFRLKPIELELKVGISTDLKGSGGVKFWVVEMGAEGSRATEATHTLKLVLEPVGPGGDEPLISDDE